MSKKVEDEIISKTLESSIVKELLSVVKEEDKKIILEALKEYSKILATDVIPNLGATFSAVQKNPSLLTKVENSSTQTTTDRKTIKDG